MKEYPAVWSKPSKMRQTTGQFLKCYSEDMLEMGPLDLFHRKSDPRNLFCFDMGAAEERNVVQLSKLMLHAASESTCRIASCGGVDGILKKWDQRAVARISNWAKKRSDVIQVEYHTRRI
ncbi:hypothetical protein CEXT_644091 [Caerostris extrusa]|uniref:Uncharacterized protein n=1 Tax=Caerostris extrusa TaxID=172846 RepID=A0AAV4TZF0_CAEEX|nr:hypothetical protein CEXT_644091 [Caerostris extrusa]